MRHELLFVASTFNKHVHVEGEVLIALLAPGRPGTTCGYHLENCPFHAGASASTAYRRDRMLTWFILWFVYTCVLLCPYMAVLRSCRRFVRKCTSYALTPRRRCLAHTWRRERVVRLIHKSNHDHDHTRPANTVALSSVNLNSTPSLDRRTTLTFRIRALDMRKKLQNCQLTSHVSPRESVHDDLEILFIEAWLQTDRYALDSYVNLCFVGGISSTGVDQV